MVVGALTLPDGTVFSLSLDGISFIISPHAFIHGASNPGGWSSIESCVVDSLSPTSEEITLLSQITEAFFTCSHPLKNSSLSLNATEQYLLLYPPTPVAGENDECTGHSNSLITLNGSKQISCSNFLLNRFSNSLKSLNFKRTPVRNYLSCNISPL